MARKKKRSVFWVVSTHVLTTGFAMPFVSGIFAYVVQIATNLSVVADFLILFACYSIGYVGGAFYSLSYIRKVALIEKPIACAKPSIIIFVGLSAIGLASNVASLFANQEQGINPTLGAIVFVLFYTVTCIVVANITQVGFSRMESNVIKG